MRLNVFQRKLKETAERVKAGELEARKEIAEEVVYRIVSRTPVDKGGARANWNVGLERNDTTTNHAPDPSGQTAITRANETLSRVQSNNTRIFITNALPYINRLENGWSDQAPNGMVAVTLAEFPIFARQKLFARIRAKLFARIGGKGGALNNV